MQCPQHKTQHTPHNSQNRTTSNCSSRHQAAHALHATASPPWVHVPTSTAGKSTTYQPHRSQPSCPTAITPPSCERSAHQLQPHWCTHHSHTAKGMGHLPAPQAAAQLPTATLAAIQGAHDCQTCWCTYQPFTARETTCQPHKPQPSFPTQQPALWHAHTFL